MRSFQTTAVRDVAVCVESAAVTGDAVTTSLLPVWTLLYPVMAAVTLLHVPMVRNTSLMYYITSLLLVWALLYPIMAAVLCSLVYLD